LLGVSGHDHQRLPVLGASNLATTDAGKPELEPSKSGILAWRVGGERVGRNGRVQDADLGTFQTEYANAQVVAAAGA